MVKIDFALIFSQSKHVVQKCIPLASIVYFQTNKIYYFLFFITMLMAMSEVMNYVCST